MINKTALSCTSAAFGELSRELLRMGKSIRFQARGVSMRPLVRDGDILLVEPLGQGPIRLGEVLLLCSAGSERLVAHRVVQRQIKHGRIIYLVQGDQVTQPDGWMEQKQILGRVSLVERDGVELDLEKPVMKALGKYAALRSRLGLGRLRLPNFGAKIARHLPFISVILK